VFRALQRFFRAIGYLFTGRVDEAAKEVSKNPYAVQATYTNIIEEKKKRIQQYKEAVAGLIAQEEKKLATVKRLGEETAKLERLKQGAAAKAKKLVAGLQAQGQSLEAIKADEEYQRCLSAFHDFSTTLDEKNEHIAELEADLGTYAKNIADHKIQLQQLLRELDKLRSEAKEAVADVITAREEKEIADMISGISEDRTSKELEQMRELRREMKAEARISHELAGTDTKRSEAEFLEYARTSADSDEFDRLIGLAAETDVDASEGEAERSRLPEN
jgi:chromosome segregation ATPase